MGNIVYERHIVGEMISLYCRKKHNTKVLCRQCESLKDYAIERFQKCPFGDEKPACKNCEVYCYKSEMREKIREVMRFSGPRMFFYYPIGFVKHLIRKQPLKNELQRLFFINQIQFISNPIFSLQVE